ncbi:MAG: ArdC-like ssDNA-binding domain-containing protein [Sphaerochaeta sp.]|jgi:antirestriction protein ArdC|nr:ArdC-like ssDNA-binding domain-containing protein [Sphaerochaeta sp.]
MAWQKMTDEQKREYAKEKHAATVDKLVKGVAELTDSEKWKDWLKWQAKFHKYSFANVMLISRQCPNASHVGGYQTVWKPLGYTIKKGEKGIYIFGAPFVIYRQREKDNGETEEYPAYRHYPILNVWDISQLDGPAEPEITKDMTGDSHSQDLAVLLEYAKANAIDVSMVDLPDNYSGDITISSSAMRLNQNKDIDHSFATVCHELAHYALHKGSTDSRASKEMDAEATSFIVAEARGLDTSQYSFGM